MALTNTRLDTTDPTTVFDAVGAQAITVIYLCNTTASVVLVNVFVIKKCTYHYNIPGKPNETAGKTCN